MHVLMVCDTLNGHNGSTKMFLKTAEGFSKRGDEVFIISFGKTIDWTDLNEVPLGVPHRILESKSHRILKSAFIRLIFGKKTFFKVDDTPSLLQQFRLWRIIGEIGFTPDLVFFLNMWCSLPLLLKSKSEVPKSCILLHEAPIFEEVPIIERMVLLSYVKMLFRKTSKMISTSDQTANNTKLRLGIASSTIYHIAFDSPKSDQKKENLIIADSRWTKEREPEFLLGIVKELPDMKFIMHGKFVDQQVRIALLREIASKNLSHRLQLIDGTSDIELVELYKRAKFYVRWAGRHEDGIGAGIINAVSYNCIPIVDDKLGSAKFVSKNISTKLVVTREPTSFVEAINFVLNDVDTYNHVMQRIRECQRNFTFEKYASLIANACFDEPV